MTYVKRMLDITPEDINDMEDERLDRLNRAGIDESNVLEQSHELANSWASYFRDNITQGKADLFFCVREQWNSQERAEFLRLGRTPLTANKLFDSTKKIIAEQRKNRPDLMVRSITGKATQEEITLRGDLVRSISYASENDLVYQTAFRSALMMSYGAFQVGVDYESPLSMNKIVKYDIINDPTMCAWDPSAQKPHKGDGNFCSRYFLIDNGEFDARYPFVTNPVSAVDPYMDLLPFNGNKNAIIVRDSFIKEWFPEVIYQLSDDQVLTYSEWKKLQKTFEDNLMIVKDSNVEEIVKKQIPSIVNERRTTNFKIMHYRMLKDQILEFKEWPSKYLPIPFVDGNSQYYEGKQYTKSFIHDGIDSQKLVNYTLSEIATELKNRRREQWIGTPDNIAGYEREWRNPELQVSMLRARPDPKTGQLPTKMPAWDISQGLFASLNTANTSLREVLGFSEAEEMQGRDMSGKARRERKLEGSMSAYVYFDNLNQAIEQGGRITLDLLPYIMGDKPRYFWLRKRDGSNQSVTINEMDKKGEMKNSMQQSSGDYDIEIDCGPSFAVQKDVALEFLADTLKAFPQSFPLIADLWVSNLDIEQKEIMKERFKTMVPPEILAKEEGRPPPPKQPNPQEQMMQMEMEEQAAALKERAHELQIREQKHELEKAKLMLDAQKMEESIETNKTKNQTEIYKVNMNYAKQIHKTLADVRKHLATKKE